MNMNDLRIAFDRFVEIWSLWMTSMAWQVAVLVAILVIAGFVLRRCSARFRFCLWTLVPVRLLLPPSLALMTGWARWIRPEGLTVGVGNEDGAVTTADMERGECAEPILYATHTGVREVRGRGAGGVRQAWAED